MSPDARSIIDGLIRATGAADAITAIRQEAEKTIDRFVEQFGEPAEMPINLRAVASYLGIKVTDATPLFSPDAEITPLADGQIEIRLNPDRPETRQRFSMGHEITHTYFPGYATQTWPRADARYRNLDKPDDYLEMLCDVGAAELVFPRRWFPQYAAKVSCAADLVRLAATFRASRHATVRRYAELNDGTVAAVFLSWKLKPSQEGEVGREDQLNMFVGSPADELRASLRLRVDYAIPSSAFGTAGHYVPRDKSVPSDGPLYLAAASGECSNGDCVLDFGPSAVQFGVMAVPLWTADADRGPNGEHAVAAIIEPREPRKPTKRDRQQQNRSLF